MQQSIQQKDPVKNLSDDVLNFTFYLLLGYTVYLYFLMIMDILRATPWPALLPFGLPKVQGISAQTADLYLTLTFGYGGARQVKAWRKVLRLKDLPDVDMARIEQQGKWLNLGAVLALGWTIIAMAGTILESHGRLTRFPDQLGPLAKSQFLFFLATKLSGRESVKYIKHQVEKRRTDGSQRPDAVEEPEGFFEEAEIDEGNAHRVSDEDRQKVVVHLKGGGSINKEECAELTGLSITQVERLIKELKKNKRIIKVGDGKSVRYKLNEEYNPEETTEQDDKTA